MPFTDLCSSPAHFMTKWVSANGCGSVRLKRSAVVRRIAKRWDYITVAIATLVFFVELQRSSTLMRRTGSGCVTEQEERAVSRMRATLSARPTMELHPRLRQYEADETDARKRKSPNSRKKK
ncbi:MAG: hypothetical protein MRJ92_07985 [Nitrospira sp.]|nr:hypothetical protein [Nitrospira sp.]